MIMNSKNAFTLAEVLVTLGIIGVVSAMTVPSLMKNHQRQVYTTQLRKAHSELMQAFENKLLDSRAVNLREARIVPGGEADFLKTYFKIAKDCGTADNSCFVTSYEQIVNSVNPNRPYETPNFLYKVVLADGTALGLKFNENTDEEVVFGLIDINGTQGPNIACRDLFLFYVLNDGTIENTGSCMNQLIQNGFVMDEKYDDEATF